MIIRYKVTLHSKNGNVKHNIGYQLYGWLMERLPPKMCDLLHANNIAPLSQYFAYNASGGEYVWNITAFEDELAKNLLKVLKSEKTINLDTDNKKFLIGDISEDYVPSVKELMLNSQKLFEDSRQIKVNFLTPTTFKQNGRYVLYPTVQMIISNLANKWNSLNKDTLIDDEYALNRLTEGLEISRYKLQSAGFYLKGVRIPGFVGEIILKARLPEPLLEIAKLLLYFADYSGIGVKSTLGMGGALTAPAYKKCEGEVDI